MKRSLLLPCAWFLYLLAWVAPVIKHGVTLPDGLPGWQAFRFALWPWDGNPDLEWYWALVSISTALTNLAMLASFTMLWSRFVVWARTFAIAGLGSFVLNAYWLLILGDDRTDLRAGYFLWWCSFLLMGIGGLAVARTVTAADMADERAVR